MARSKAVTLPEEILVDILSRLPVKSIGQYRCVSKQWCNFLSDPQFIKLHFNLHSHNHEEKLIFVSQSHALYSITFNDNPQNGIMDAISRNINFQQDNWLRVAGSCNGLVLVENMQHIMFLMNPTTLEYHTSPNSRLALPQQSSYSVYGLGYDFASDDYKVVTLCRYEGHIGTTYVDVYSVRMGVWRRIESLPYDDVLPKRGDLLGCW